MEDVKPDLKLSQGSKVGILVKSQGHGELIFKVKLTTPFSKVATAFCKSKNLSPKTVRFLSDGGTRLHCDTNKTIGELGLDVEEDEDGEPMIYIDAMYEQTGGKC